MSTQLPTACRLIQERVPELFKGLAPGARIRRGTDWPIDTIVTIHKEFVKNEFEILLCREGMNITFDLRGLSLEEVESWSILGSPIHLEHLLQAFERAGYRWVFSVFGIKVYTTDSEGVKEILIPYNLSLPFDQQSEAFYEGVVKVLE